VKAGRLRALAITSAQPSALVPGVPTIAGAGVPGYESVAILSIFAPAKTPSPLVNRINQELVRVLNQADVKERLFSIGVEPIGSTPEQLAATMKSEMARMGKVIRDAGIKTD
jgi:tripartite-type tricarboxylate transporter receptor subunit TctC